MPEASPPAPTPTPAHPRAAALRTSLPLLAGVAYLAGCGAPARPPQATPAAVSRDKEAAKAPELPQVAPMSIQAQGRSLQGMSLQGTQLQGRNLQGVSLGGLSLQGSTVVGLRAGSTLRGTLADGSSVQLVIGSVERDDSDAEITLYTVLYRNAETGALENACPADPYGVQKAIAVAGTWDARGARVPSTTQFTLGCTSGVIAKCVLWGYKPWKQVSGVSLADYHQACTRMARADYCGDGTSHTFDGTWIDVFDRLGIQKKTADQGGMLFEASWSTNGATCVSKPRWYGMALVRDGSGQYPTKCENRVDALSLGEIEELKSNGREDTGCDVRPQTGTVLVQNTSFINVVDP